VRGAGDAQAHPLPRGRGPACAQTPAQPSPCPAPAQPCPPLPSPVAPRTSSRRSSTSSGRAARTSIASGCRALRSRQIQM
jgi:hypothetical protein